MAVQTPVLRPAAARPASHRAASRTLSAKRVSSAPSVMCERPNSQRIEAAEDRLLENLLNGHANRDAALDRMLADMDQADDLSAGLQEARRPALLLRSASRLNHMEDLLLAAVIRTHPNGDRGLDHLLADLTPDDTGVAAEDRAREAFDTQIDNDFDGLC